MKPDQDNDQMVGNPKSPRTYSDSWLHRTEKSSWLGKPQTKSTAALAATLESLEGSRCSRASRNNDLYYALRIAPSTSKSTLTKPLADQYSRLIDMVKHKSVCLAESKRRCQDLHFF